jgi:hypothetical protein
MASNVKMTNEQSSSLTGEGNSWAPNEMLKKRDFQDPHPARNMAEFYAQYDPNVGIVTALFLIGFMCFIMAQIGIKWTVKKVNYLKMLRVYNRDNWRLITPPAKETTTPKQVKWIHTYTRTTIATLL